MVTIIESSAITWIIAIVAAALALVGLIVNLTRKGPKGDRGEQGIEGVCACVLPEEMSAYVEEAENRMKALINDNATEIRTNADSIEANAANIVTNAKEIREEISDIDVKVGELTSGATKAIRYGANDIRIVSHGTYKRNKIFYIDQAGVTVMADTEDPSGNLAQNQQRWELLCNSEFCM